MCRWRGVVAVEDTYTDDRRRITETDLPGSGLPMRAYSGDDSLLHLVGAISRLWREGKEIHAEGSIRDSYAGQTLTGGVDTEGGVTVPQLSNGIWSHTIHGAALTGFVIHDNPTWPQVQIIVEAHP